ncbi:hypothetical protein [Tautonia sociabilis]|uniref:Uncharacterized protein n=1 Tax=Tautonia sociabilis TaxID=2080755 RepID=A0A432MKD8_9BACT|nr:hypothetical protein [Tautonia sociabilis]RUL87884.1 hypothetical protein TsocGM_10145 [Tautonia sociabilis]
MDGENPYQAPASPTGPSPRPKGPGRRPGRRMLVGWLAVLLVNLPVPLMFGSWITDRDGTIGMGAAVVLLAGVGGWAILRSFRVGLALIVGGSAVALSQVVPMLQFVAGMIGVSLAKAIGLAEPGPWEEPTVPGVLGAAGGFVVTVVTGTLLLAVSLGIGLVLQVITPGRWWGLDSGIGPDPSS